MIRRVPGVLVAAALFMAPGVSFACSTFFCEGGAHTVPADKGRVPANGGFFWMPLDYYGPDGLDEQIDTLTLTREDTGALVDITVTAAVAPHFYQHMTVSQVVPNEPLIPGVSYTLRSDHSACDGWMAVGPLQPTVVAGDEAPLPSSIGTLSAGEPERRLVEVAEDSGCSWEQDVLIADLTLELDPSMEPWRDVVAFETVVDGELWRPSHSSGNPFELGSSWTGRATDAVFAICNESPYSEYSWLEPGTHTAMMRAHLPGTDQVWESNTLTLDLDCAPASGHEDPAPDDDTDSEEDDGDGGSDAAADSGDDAAGCSTSRSGAAWPMALLLLGYAVRRRRRH